MSSATLAVTYGGSESWHPANYVDFYNEFNMNLAMCVLTYDGSGVVASGHVYRLLR